MYRRIQEGTGCPACSHRVLVQGINDLETECPELALNGVVKMRKRQMK